MLDHQGAGGQLDLAGVCADRKNYFRQREHLLGGIDAAPNKQTTTANKLLNRNIIGSNVVAGKYARKGSARLVGVEAA